MKETPHFFTCCSFLCACHFASQLASSQTKCFPNLYSMPLKILSYVFSYAGQQSFQIRSKNITQSLSYFFFNTRNSKTHSGMCMKAKFLIPQFRSSEANTPDVHYHTHSTLFMYDDALPKTICRLYFCHFTSFPRLSRKGVL